MNVKGRAVCEGRWEAKSVSIRSRLTYSIWWTRSLICIAPINIVELNYHCSTNSGPPSVKRLFQAQFISLFFLSPSFTVGQVPLAYLAYPWSVTYIHPRRSVELAFWCEELAGWLYSSPFSLNLVDCAHSWWHRGAKYYRQLVWAPLLVYTDAQIECGRRYIASHSSALSFFEIWGVEVACWKLNWEFEFYAKGTCPTVIGRN